MENVKVEKTASRIDIKATLKGRVHEHPWLTKRDHLILMISSHTESTMSGDFHLKTNFVFDIFMGIGSVTFTRML